MQKIGWQNYVISIILTLCFIIGMFKLKLILGHNISVSIRTVCIGMIIALFISGAFLIFKKRIALLLFSIILLIIWLMVSDDRIISSAIFSAGSVGLLGSVPFTASVLSCRYQKQGKKE